MTADDFGRTRSIHAAVIQAHREGILTCASLMVAEADWEAAVSVARDNPRLGLGLHLSLCGGRSVLPPDRIPGLVGADGCFERSPVRAGFRYFFRPALRAELEAEIRAQFDRFRSTDLPLDHVNGHLNIHMHPAIRPKVLELAVEYGARGVRWVRDPLGLNLRLASGEWGYRFSHALIFGVLSAWAGRRVRSGGVRRTDRVIGLLQSGRVDEAFLLGLLARLPPGDTELYSHPDLGDSRHELEALVSERVRRAVDAAGVELVRYGDLGKDEG